MIKFIYKDKGFDLAGIRVPSKKVEMKLTDDALTIEEMCSEFEMFLKSIGYVLPEGVHIGYETDE